MKKVIIYIFVMVMCLISLQSIDAASIAVHPGDSIQTAVNSAASGDTITVYGNNNSGYTYKESVNINKKLSIKASGNVTIAAKDSSSSVFSISSAASGTSIQNFSLSNSNYCIVLSNANNCLISGNNIVGASLVGVQFYGNVNNSRILNNMITGLSPTYGNGISFENGYSTNNVLDGNVISNFLNGILFNDNSENNTVNNNKVSCTGYTGAGIYSTDNSRSMQITGNTITGAEDGLSIEQMGTNTATNYLISGNTFSGNKNGAWMVLCNSTISYNTALQNNVSGLDITGNYNIINNNILKYNSVVGISLSQYSNADYNSVFNNTFTLNENGIICASPNSNIHGNNISYNNETGLTITTNNCNVTGNIMSNNGDSGITVTGTGCNVIGNRLENNLYGATFNSINAAVMHLNSIVNNSYQVYCANAQSGKLNATNNWWGSNCAPVGTYGPFDLSKWLVLSLNANPVQIGCGGTSIITLDLTRNNAGENVSLLYPGQYVTDGIPVNFNCDALGSLSSKVAYTLNGSAKTNFTGISKGVSVVTASLNNQNLSSSVTIISSTSPTSIIVNPATGQKGDNINLIATLTDNKGAALSGKKINFYINGVLVGNTNTNTNGTATYLYTITQNSGSYVILAQFPGDTTYSAVNSTNSLQVNLIPTTISVNPITGCKGDNVNLTSALKDQDNAGVSGKTISYYVNGVLVGTAATDSSGIATRSYTLTQNIGNYIIKALYSGDTSYAAVNNTNTLTINPTPSMITVNPITGYRGDNINVTSTLKDNKGVTLSGKTINYYINGALIGTATTDSSGIATYLYTITQGAGTYIVQAIFSGDTTYAAANNTNNLVVNLKPTNITVNLINGYKGDNVNLTASLKDNRGSLLNGKIINFYVNGASVGSGTSNTNGIATYLYTITQNIGSYIIQAQYSGDTTYAASTNTNNLIVNLTPTRITVNPVAGNKGKNINLTSVLKDNKGSIISGKNINYYINNAQTGTATTDNSGTATYVYTITQDTGTYTIEAQYNGDTTYTAATNTNNLIVNLLPTTITLNPASGYNGDSVNLAATLKDNKGNLLNGKIINYYINGILKGTAATDSSGTATYLYTITQNVGTYTMQALFSGDTTYAGSNITNNLIVNSIPAALTTNPISGYKGQVVDLTARLSDLNNDPICGKNIQFLVDETVVGNADTDIYGIATVPYVISLTSGVHNIVAQLIQDCTYANCYDTNNLQVNKTPTIITLNPLRGYYGDKLYLTTKLIDDNNLPLTGQKVNFFVNGVAVGTAFSNSSGVASLKYLITQKSGKYSIKAQVVEDLGVNTVTSNNILTVYQIPTKIVINPVTTKHGYKVKLVACLTNTHNNSKIAGKKVYFYVNGRVVGSGITNKYGLASFIYTVTQRSGKYKIVAQIISDSLYKGTNNSNILKVA